jgi:hypothetical protein
MADEHIRSPENQLRRGQPPAGVPADRSEAPADADDTTDHLPSFGAEVLQYFRWLVGMILVLCVGWGFIAFVAYLAYTSRLPLALNVAVISAAVLDLGIFLLLEHKLWLSRFMGLRIGPHSSPVLEAVLLWLFGIGYLMFRSTASAEPATTRPRAAEYTDSFREVMETVVFVVVLVLMLKAFVAEAFVIPTGSMATTLRGYHLTITCPQCGHTQPVNCSSEVEPQKNRAAEHITGCTCENCRYHIRFDQRNPAERTLP